MRRTVVALLLVGCGGGADAPRPDPPSVVLVTIDTLRADHVGAYGYTRDTTPHLDALAEEGVLYRESRATSPWTLPTHASLFTGLFPFEHGAHTFAVDTPRANAGPLRSEHVTLAEALRDRGYATGAFVANAAYLDPSFGLDQGFDTYQVERLRGRELCARAVSWVASVQPPYFLFVNLMDAHRPYNIAPADRDWEVPSDDPAQLLDRLCEAVLVRGEDPAELREQVRAQYDAGIAHADAALGALLNALSPLEDTVVVVTSDHGEYFGEHGLVEHSKDVYEPALRIPLVVRGPVASAHGPDVSMSSVDVPYLVLEQIGALESTGALFPHRPGNHPVFAENHFSRVKDLFHPYYGHRFQRQRLVLFDGSEKYVHSSDARHELYDLGQDPGELTNLLEDRPDRAQRMADTVRDYVQSRAAGSGPGDAPELSEERAAELRALGYL